MVFNYRKRKSSSVWVKRTTKKPKYGGKAKGTPIRFKLYSKLKGNKLFRMTKRKYKNQQLGVPRSLKSIGSKISRDGQTTAKPTVSYLNMQHNYGAQKFDKSLGSQPYQMVLSETTQLSSQVQTQNTLVDSHMDNWHYDSTTVVGPEFPHMWQIVKNQMRSANDTTLGQPQVLLLEELRRQQIYLRSHIVEYTLVNSTNAPMVLTIREYSLKADGYDLPTVSWQTGLDVDDNNGGTLYNANTGIYNSSRHTYTPYCKPMESPDFRKRFYQTHERTIQVEAGQIHYHTVNMTFNRIIEWSDLYALDGQMALGTNKYRQPFTRFTSFTILGARAESTTLNKLGYAASQLNIFSEKKTTFHTYGRRQLRKFYRNALDQTVTAGEMEIVQEDGDITLVEQL